MVEVVVAVAFTVLCHLVLKRRKARLDHYLLLRTAGDVTGSAGVTPALPWHKREPAGIFEATKLSPEPAEARRKRIIKDLQLRFPDRDWT
jgi:hypothetical protein